MVDWSYFAVRSFKKVRLPHFLACVGCYCDGTFDPDHIDFDVCIGLWHVAKVIPYLTAASASIVVTDIVVFAWFRLFFPLAVAAYCVLPLVSAVFGIVTKRYNFLLFYVLNTVVVLAGSAVLLVLLVVAVFDITSPLFTDIWEAFGTEMMDTQLALLLIIVIIAVDWGIIMWLAWIHYIYYCYLKGCLGVAEGRIRLRLRRIP